VFRACYLLNDYAVWLVKTELITLYSRFLLNVKTFVHDSVQTTNFFLNIFFSILGLQHIKGYSGVDKL